MFSHYKLLLFFSSLLLVARLFADQPIVLVTLAPHKQLVQRLAGDTVRVEQIVPTDGNVHSFEPTPQQASTAAQARLWFRLGEAFEPKLARVLQEHNPKIQLVDLWRVVDLIEGEHASCCGHEGADLHYWLSAREMAKQARLVTEQLTGLFPSHKERYRQALEGHLQELSQLDRELTQKLSPIRGKTLLVVHPAYGYFCRDYGLKQLSIEVEGRDPSARQLSEILREARRLALHTVFSQVQINPKLGQLLRDQLGPQAQVETFNPYAENYMDTLGALSTAALGS